LKSSPFVYPKKLLSYNEDALHISAVYLAKSTRIYLDNAITPFYRFPQKKKIVESQSSAPGTLTVVLCPASFGRDRNPRRRGVTHRRGL
jgi:hypothetical protein